MKRLCAFGLGLGLAACGAPQTNPPALPQPALHAEPTAERAPVVIEYVVIRRQWIEKVLAASPTDVKAWAEAPENAGAASGPFRHILIKVAVGKDEASAMKRAQAILDRLKKGEDFASLARQYSEDPGSKSAGGEYSADKVASFVEPVRTAFAALKPGETTPDVVKTTFGFHMIKKERAAEQDVEIAYRRATAPAAAKALGEDLLTRLRPATEARPAIAEAVTAVLGERATNDADRPTALVVDRERSKQLRLPAAAKAAIETFAAGAHPGDRLTSPAIDGEVIVVARALQHGSR